MALYQAAGSRVRIGSGIDADCFHVDVKHPSEEVNLPEGDADSACLRMRGGLTVLPCLK